MLLGRDDDSAVLLVGEELDASVREDAQQRRRVTPEQTAETFTAANIAEGPREAEPVTGIFREMGVGGLEEDFDAVQRSYYGFGL